MAHSAPGESRRFMEGGAAELSAKREEKLYRQPRLRGHCARAPRYKRLGECGGQEGEGLAVAHHILSGEPQEQFGFGPEAGAKPGRFLWEEGMGEI